MLKKQLTKIALAAILLTTAITPQKSQAGIIIGAATAYETIKGVSQAGEPLEVAYYLLLGTLGLGLTALVAAPGVLLVKNAASGSFGNIAGIVLLALDENSVPTDELSKKLNILYPEINDQSILQDLSSALLENEIPASKLVEVKLAPELTASILERSDLSQKQVLRIVDSLK